MICPPAILIVTGMSGRVSIADYCNPWTCFIAAKQITEGTSNTAVCRMVWR